MVSFNTNIIGYINIFEKTTKAEVKDCFQEDNQLTFVVQPGQAGKAIGKKGSNIKQVANLLKKNIAIIEFNPDPTKFAKNLISPTEAETNIDNNTLIIKSRNSREKGILIGRNKQKLKKIQTLIQKYFKLETKVI